MAVTSSVGNNRFLKGRESAFFVMSKNQVSLSIGGKNYYGWLSVSVIVALQSIARSFSVSLTSKSSPYSSGAAKIRVGDDVELSIGGDLVLSGYVTNVDESYSGSTNQINIKGYSKTVDLIDCSVPDGKPLSYKKQTPIQIVSDMASHYGIGLEVKALKSDAVDFDISPEEKIKEALDRLIKKYSLLLTDNENGKLVLTQIGAGGICHDKIQLGANILSGKRSLDGKNLFSRYVLLGQGANPLSERPVTDNHLKAVSVDSDVRHRVKTIVQTGDASAAGLQSRVNVVMQQSRAQAETLSYKVRGWRQSNGELWPINAFVLVDDDKLGIRRELLIAGVNYSLDDKGMVTTIDLKMPEEFSIVDAPTAEAAIKTFALNKVGAVGKATWTGK